MNPLSDLRFILPKLGLHTDPDAFLTLFTLAMARTGAALPLIPFLGGRTVPGQVRLGLSILMGILLYPTFAAQSSEVPRFIGYLPLLLKEILAGAVIGLLVQILFAAAEAAGSFIETVAELRPQEFLAPQLQSASGPLSALLGQAAIVLFVTAGVHLLVIRAIADSYTVLPLLSMPSMQAGALSLAEEVGKVSVSFFIVAFQLAAPILLVLVMIKMASAFMFRMSFARVSSDPFHSAAPLAAYGLLFLGAAIYGQDIANIGGRYVNEIYRFVRALR